MSILCYIDQANLCHTKKRSAVRTRIEILFELDIFIDYFPVDIVM